MPAEPPREGTDKAQAGTSAPHEGKTDEPSGAKSEPPARIIHSQRVEASPRTTSEPLRPTVAATDDLPGNAPATAHQTHLQIAQQANAASHTAATDARAEATAPPANAPAGSNAPILSINLATSTLPLPTMFPITMLRVEAAADNPVPVSGLAVEIVSRAQDGLRRFDIRLDPPELGRIDVRLDVDSGGKVISHLTVQRAETLDLLRRDAPQLERALQHAGLNTEGGLEFSLRDQNFANREQPPRDVPIARLIVPDDEPAAAEAARRGYGRLIGLGGGVDIRV